MAGSFTSIPLKISLNFGKTKLKRTNSIRTEKHRTKTGYIIALLILPLISASYSKKPLSRSRILSRMPPTSAARTMFT